MNKTHNPLPPESQTVEWKQSLGEWKEIVETCAAFATSEGGTIYVGISPKGDPVGVELGKDTLEDMANKIKVNTDPAQFPSIEVDGPESATQSATQSTDPVTRLLTALKDREMSSSQLREVLRIKHRPTFRQNYLHPALKEGFIEYTMPGTPNSRLQKYRLTRQGVRHLKSPDGRRRNEDTGTRQ